MDPMEEAKNINYEALEELNLELMRLANDFTLQGERAKAKPIYIAHELFEKILKNKAPQQVQQALFNTQEYTKSQTPYGL